MKKPESLIQSEIRLALAPLQGENIRAPILSDEELAAFQTPTRYARQYREVLL